MEPKTVVYKGNRSDQSYSLGEAIAAIDKTQLAATLSSLGNSETDFSRFTRLRDHARGGLGVVCVAMDQQFNREVALKEIRDDARFDQLFPVDFERQATQDADVEKE